VLGFLELPLLIGQFAEFIRINALEAFLLLLELLEQGGIVITKLIQLGLVRDAVSVQLPNALTLRVKGQMFHRNLILGFIFELECHNFFPHHVSGFAFCFPFLLSAFYFLL
jgi:hypothetical protein